MGDSNGTYHVSVHGFASAEFNIDAEDWEDMSESERERLARRKFASDAMPQEMDNFEAVKEVRGDG